jgi:hypothetical protein
MCTNIMEQATIRGSAKAAGGQWFTVDRITVGFDHPFHIPLEHALTIDFVNEMAGPGARVAVELTRDSALRLAEAINAALERGVDVSEGGDPGLVLPSSSGAAGGRR